MLTETVFRSEDLPASDRFGAWCERMNRTHAPMRLASECAADFHAYQRLIGLGAVSMWPASFEQLVFLRTPELIRRSDPEVYHLSLLRSGKGGGTWGRQEITYGAGDFHLNDSSRPYEIWTGQGVVSSVGVEIPKALLPLPPSCVDHAVGRHLSANGGPGMLLAQFLTQLSADTGAYRPSDGPRLATVLVDLVAAMLAHAVDSEAGLPPETRTRALTLRVRSFIHEHLHDPELTPSHIAAALNISRRHLHRLFRDETDTVASYIRRHRLAGAHRDLADPTLAHTPIHVIATRWGYPHAPEFTRAFRAAYGMAPREHRCRASSGPGTEGAEAPPVR